MYKLEIEKDSIFIIDGSNLMHRNYHVNKELKTTTGRYTGAIFGTIKMLFNYYNLYNPSKIIICFDKGKKTFRHKYYNNYKQNRSSADNELTSQFPLLLEFCKCTNIPYIANENYEADDLIGSLAKKCNDYGLKPYVITGDKDLFQLIDDNIDILYLSKKDKCIVKYDIEKFEEDMGINVNEFVDFKALYGDIGDNIPGVKGIGEKNAIKLLNKYHSLDNIYKNIEEITGKNRENLLNQKDNAILSKFLANIVTDITLPYNEILNCNIQYDFNNDNLKNFLEELEINSLI